MPVPPPIDELFDEPAPTFEATPAPAQDVDSLFAEAEAELADELRFPSESGSGRVPSPMIDDDDFDALRGDSDIADDVEEIDENTILEALEEDDDDLAGAFGDLLLPDEDVDTTPKTLPKVPPPPVTGAQKKLK
jgi:hypothetical protein